MMTVAPDVFMITAGQIWVGVFGKHPAWTDFPRGLKPQGPFIPDLEDEIRRTSLRSLLEQNPPLWRSGCVVESTSATEWEWLVQKGENLALGFMWPSRDMSGRSEYPFSVWIHMTCRNPDWFERTFRSLLFNTAAQLRTVDTPDQVFVTLDQLRDSAERLAQESPAEWNLQEAAVACLDAVVEQSKVEGMQRLLGWISSSWRPLGIGAGGDENAGQKVYPTLRLPALPGLEGVTGPQLSRWLAFFRTQLNFDAQLTLVCAGGLEWCDASAGRISPDLLLRIQRPLSDADFATRQSDSEMGLNPISVESLRENLLLPWGSPGKRSVFGEVPTAFVPGPMRSAPVDTEPSIPNSTVPKGPSREPEPTPRGKQKTQQDAKRRKVPAWLIALIGASAASILVVLILVFVGAFRSGLSSDGSTNAGGASTNSSSTLADLWFLYVNDYERWLWALGNPPAKELWALSDLTNATARLFEASSVTELDPLRIVKRPGDLTMRIHPSKSALNNSSLDLTQAFKYRDQVRQFLTTTYPGQWEGVAASSGTVVLTNFDLAFKARLQRVESDLLQAIAPFTNEPPSSRQLDDRILTPLKELVQIRVDAAAVRGQWNKLEETQAAFQELDGQWLSGVMAQARASLLSDSTAPVRRLESLLADTEKISRWTNSEWAQVDRTSLKLLLDKDRPDSFSRWLGAASNSVRFSSRDDPRGLLSVRILSNDIPGMISALIIDSQPGASDLRDRWLAISNQWNDLQTIPAIRANLAALSTQAAAGVSNLNRVQPEIEHAFAVAFDFDGFARQRRERRFDQGVLDQVWITYLDSDLFRSPAKTKVRPPNEVIRLRRQIEASEQFLAAVQSQRVGLLGGLLPEGETVPREDDLIWKYCSDRYLMEVARFGLKTNGPLLVNPAQVRIPPELTQSFKSWWSAVLLFRRDVSTWMTHPRIPDSLEALELAAKVILAPPKPLSNDQNIPEMAKFRSWASVIVSGQKVPDVPSTKTLDPVATLVQAARRQTSGTGPQTSQEWTETVQVAAGLKALVSSAPAASVGLNWSGWLTEQWNRAARSGKALAASRDWLGIATNAGIATVNLPPVLVYDAGLMEFQNAVELPSADLATMSRHAEQLLEFATRTPKNPSMQTNESLLKEIVRLLRENAVWENTEWTNLAPVRAGWKVEPSPVQADEAIIRGPQIEMGFRGVKSATGGRPFFLAKNELSASELGGMSQTSKLIVLGTPFEDTIVPLVAELGLPVDKPAEIAPAFFLHTWGTRIDDKFKTSEINTQFPPGSWQAAIANPGRMPANMISPRWASEIAGALGCRLPTPGEWRDADRTISAENGGVWWNPARAALINQMIKQAKVDGVVVKSKWFWGKGPSEDRTTSPSGPGSTDLMAPADDPTAQNNGFTHWHGNLAEILQEGPRYFIAGGSFASSSRETQPTPLNPKDQSTNRPYADVGVRLAFDWVGIDPVARARQRAVGLQCVSPP